MVITKAKNICVQMKKKLLLSGGMKRYETNLRPLFGQKPLSVSTVSLSISLLWKDSFKNIQISALAQLRANFGRKIWNVSSLRQTLPLPRLSLKPQLTIQTVLPRSVQQCSVWLNLNLSLSWSLSYRNYSLVCFTIALYFLTRADQQFQYLIWNRWPKSLIRVTTV